MKNDEDAPLPELEATDVVESPNGYHFRRRRHTRVTPRDDHPTPIEVPVDEMAAAILAADRISVAMISAGRIAFPDKTYVALHLPVDDVHWLAALIEASLQRSK